MIAIRQATSLELPQHETVERQVPRTGRNVWGRLADKLHPKTIADCLAGLAAVTKHPPAGWKRPGRRIDAHFGRSRAIKVLHNRFRAARYDPIRHATRGPVWHNQFDAHKEENARLRWRVRSLTGWVGHAWQRKLNRMAVPGGGRIMGRDERALRPIGKNLTTPPSGSADGRARPSARGTIRCAKDPGKFERLDAHTVAGLVYGLAGLTAHAPACRPAAGNRSRGCLLDRARA